MMINNRDYTEYIIQNGNKLNKELKNNIDYCLNDLTRILLIDYIKDTMDNYDYRNCPDYNNIEDPLLPEDDFSNGIITEDELFLFLTEDENSTIMFEDWDIPEVLFFNEVQPISIQSFANQINMDDIPKTYDSINTYYNSINTYASTSFAVSDYLESEQNSNYISSEKYFERYIFDKLLIERILQHLINDIECLK